MSDQLPRPQIHEPANKIVAEYLSEKIPVFVELEAIRKKCWANPEGDIHWQNKRDNADKATEAAARKFYKMAQEIAEEMQAKTSALTPGLLGVDVFKSLDLCMAPGGFTWGTLQHNASALAFGITLAPKVGGYENHVALPAEHVKYMDVTMLAGECGVDVATIPEHHPDRTLFLAERPFLEHRFQLVFCGGAVLRGQERGEHRRCKIERTRLTMAQLVLGMQRIAAGGTMVVLLRRPEVWDVVQLLRQFGSFAEVQVFKSQRKHAVRSTFYLVAKNVRPESESAKAALEEWKESWVCATFGGKEGTGEDGTEPNLEIVKAVLEEFGPKLIQLATPLWKIQARELKKQDKESRKDSRKKQGSRNGAWKKQDWRK